MTRSARATAAAGPKDGLVRESAVIDLTGKPPLERARAAKEVPGGVLVRVDIDRIFPSRLNDKVYRPVDPGDPAVRSLARDIGAIGLQEPIVITRDFFILSGHRRFMACKLLGLKAVDCRFADITSRDPGFPQLLVSYNNQRVKSLDEVLRERVISSSNDGSAYQALRNHRAEKAEVEAEFLEIGEKKVRPRISKGKLPMLWACTGIIDAKRPYWPLSDREVHYDLLNDPPLRHASKPDSVYSNNKDCYKDATDILTRGRLEGYIPFTAIGDPTRKVVTWNPDRTPGAFIERSIEGFLKDYCHDLMQSQPNHIEIIGEKNTIESSIRGVAAKYTIPYTLGRGYCSIDPVYRMVQRFKKGGKQTLIILVMSDFDPEGEDIPLAFAKQLRDDFGVRSVEVLKVGLTLAQVRRWGLPPNAMLEEKNGSRKARFEEKYGKEQSAHELESLRPEERAKLLEDAILSVIDIDAYNHELEQEEQHAARIEEVRNRALEAMADVLGDGPEEDD
jgi:hypothetical protein